MLYRIYAYAYEYGWELYATPHKKKEVDEIIENLDHYEYGQYIVVKQTDRDDVVDMGFFDKIEKKADKGYEKRKSRRSK